MVVTEGLKTVRNEEMNESTHKQKGFKNKNSCNKKVSEPSRLPGSLKNEKSDYCFSIPLYHIVFMLRFKNSERTGICFNNNKNNTEVRVTANHFWAFNSRACFLFVCVCVCARECTTGDYSSNDNSTYGGSKNLPKH